MEININRITTIEVENGYQAQYIKDLWNRTNSYTEFLRYQGLGHTRAEAIGNLIENIEKGIYKVT